MSNSKMYKATLVRGKSYRIGSEAFEGGKPRTIDETLMRKIKNSESAYDILVSRVGDEKESIKRPKFKFEELKGVVAKPKKSRADELAEMQGDGGVDDFEEDEDFDDADEADDEEDFADDETEDAEDEEDDAEEEVQEVKKKPAKKSATKSRRRK